MIKFIFFRLFYYLKLTNFKIIRIDSHNNDIKVFYSQTNKIYRKETNTLYGKFLLENELNGLKWYSRITKVKILDLIIKKKIKNKKFYIDLQEYQGKKINYQNQLSSTKKYILKTIKFYKKLWPLKKRVPCHGDLTLDNIIFSNKNLYIIDWECFEKKGDFWGSDLVYLVLSAVVLPNYKNGYISKGDQKILKEIWKKLKKLKINKKITDDPINFFKHKFKKKHWKNLINRSPNKFFPTFLKESFINQLNSIIN